MGVMACNREGCKNIMCDRYSDKFGYICHECFAELIELCTHSLMQNDEAIRKFMDTPKQKTRWAGSQTRKAIQEELNQEFSLR